MINRWIAWAKLVRLPNTPTVLADVLVGFALVAGDWSPALPLILACVAIVLLYWAGMVWNDVADVEQDRRERPDRPLPSGAVSTRSAFNVGMLLLAVGIALAFAADWSLLRSLDTDQVHSGTGLTAIILVASILLYDLVAKKTLAAPWLMGSCRACSLLVGGMAAGLAADPVETHVPRMAILVAAIGHGVFVAGFTLAGRKEAATSAKSDLWCGWIICLVGIGLLGLVDWVSVRAGIDPAVRRLDKVWMYPLLILVLALPLIRRAWKTFKTNAGRDIQAAIKQSIVSIIFFDAALALQFGSSAQAIVICSLVIPMLFLGQWLYST